MAAIPGIFRVLERSITTGRSGKLLGVPSIDIEVVGGLIFSTCVVSSDSSDTTTWQPAGRHNKSIVRDLAEC